jgi:F-type H+-transporting ATPase subunit alpha
VDTSLKYEEVGTVLQVSDGVARIYGLEGAEAGELLEFEGGVTGVVMNLEEDNVGAVLFGSSEHVKEGYNVRRTHRIASVMVSEEMVGRVINPLGEAIDGRGEIGGERFEMPLERKAPGVVFRQPVSEPLQTGLKAVDAMIPIGRGQRELIIGDRQTGKTAIAIDTIINQRAGYLRGEPVYCIYVAVGQKGSTVATIVNTLREKGAMDYTIVVAATASDPAASNILPPLLVRPLASTSAIRAATHLWSTTTCRSRPWPIVRCRSSCAAPRVGRPTRAISSTSTHAFWREQPRLLAARRLPRR